MMGLQSDEPYGAHFIQGGLQGATASCSKPVRGAEEEESPGAHIPDFSHFSNKQTGLNGFSPWTNTSTSSSSSSPQLQSTIPGLFHSHPLLSHHHHQPHAYYGPQSHPEHLAPAAASESRFVRCWEGATPTQEPALTQAFPACLPPQNELSSANATSYEAVKPESSPPSTHSPEESSFASPREVVLERLGTAEELGRKAEPKKESEEKKPQEQPPEPGKDFNTRVRNVY